LVLCRERLLFFRILPAL